MKKKDEKSDPIEPIVHEANGSFITKGVADYIKAQILEKDLKIAFLKMAKSQWKKIVKQYEEIDGMKEGNQEFITVEVKLDRVVPESEIWYCAADGMVLGKIVGLER
jgi:hypothetical protein